MIIKSKLEQASDYLESHELEEGIKFNMNHWHVKTECGTIQCAGGILARAKLFGLSLRNLFPPGSYNAIEYPMFKGHTECQALAKALSITLEESRYIFDSESYPIKPKPTLEHVLAHMKEIIENKSNKA